MTHGGTTIQHALPVSVDQRANPLRRLALRALVLVETLTLIACVMLVRAALGV